MCYTHSRLGAAIVRITWDKSSQGPLSPVAETVNRLPSVHDTETCEGHHHATSFHTLLSVGTCLSSLAEVSIANICICVSEVYYLELKNSDSIYYMPSNVLGTQNGGRGELKYVIMGC